jgi:hypothetical protein
MVLSIEKLENIIILIRGQKVILDEHLSKLYDVTTGILIQAIKRSIVRRT